VVESGAIVCVGLWTGAVEQPATNGRTPNNQHPTPNFQVRFITASFQEMRNLHVIVAVHCHSSMCFVSASFGA
jgi:hypothetical protein